MNTSVEGKHVMLAERIKIDVLDNNHLIASLFVKDGTLKNGNWILLVTTSQISHCPGHTKWSLQEPLPRRVLAQ